MGVAQLSQFQALWIRCKRVVLLQCERVFEFVQKSRRNRSALVSRIEKMVEKVAVDLPARWMRCGRCCEKRRTKGFSTDSNSPYNDYRTLLQRSVEDPYG